MPNKLTAIEVNEVSGVAAAANRRKFVISKADTQRITKADDAIALIQKYYGEAGEEIEAIDFDTAMVERAIREAEWKRRSEMWECFSALQESVESIISDPEVESKKQAIAMSLGQFFAALGEKGLIEKMTTKTDDQVEKGKMGTKLKRLYEKMAGIMGQFKEAMDMEEAPAPPVAKQEGETVTMQMQTGEPVAKSADLIAIEKQLEDIKKQNEELKAKAEAAEAIAKAEQDKRETGEFVALAKSAMSNLVSTTPDELGPILKEAKAKLSKENFDKLEVTLKASSEAIAKGDLFKEKGAGGGGDSSSSPSEQLEAIAKAKVEKGEAKDFREAMAKAAQENPHLYRDHAKSVAVNK